MEPEKRKEHNRPGGEERENGKAHFNNRRSPDEVEGDEQRENENDQPRHHLNGRAEAIRDGLEFAGVLPNDRAHQGCPYQQTVRAIMSAREKNTNPTRAYPVFRSIPG
jgi:hypothetical protein